MAEPPTKTDWTDIVPNVQNMLIFTILGKRIDCVLVR